MIVEPIARSPQPAWRQDIDRHPEPADQAEPTAPFPRAANDSDPEPPPAAPAMPWPRVFPGL